MAFLTSSPGMLPVPHTEEEGELRRQVLFLSKPHSLYKTLSDDVLSLTKSNNQAVPMKIDEKNCNQEKVLSVVCFSIYSIFTKCHL